MPLWTTSRVTGPAGRSKVAVGRARVATVSNRRTRRAAADHGRSRLPAHTRRIRLSRSAAARVKLGARRRCPQKVALPVRRSVPSRAGRRAGRSVPVGSPVASCEEWRGARTRHTLSTLRPDFCPPFPARREFGCHRRRRFQTTTGDRPRQAPRHAAPIRPVHVPICRSSFGRMIIATALPRLGDQVADARQPSSAWLLGSRRTRRPRRCSAARSLRPG